MLRKKFTKSQKIKRRKKLIKKFGKPDQPRFYYWEIVPSYGLRQMGYQNGYSSIAQLKAKEKSSIAVNKRRGYPMFILRAEMVKEM